MAPSIHPFIDNGITKGDPNFSGGTISCKCPSNKVTVALKSNVAHNHFCGCSKCWKPAGSLFSSSGIDPSAAIQRNACKECGVHLFGRIEVEHPFHGLDFVHVELSEQKGWQEPQFAAFVSSIIEQGFNPKEIDAVRGKFKANGLETYDTPLPVLMDLIATFTAQKAGHKFANL
ncbi:glutathione-dependent formaldehyde-activating enzyme [Penicillium chermesinum]|nr:glutathione-dependent formaldehyde-activating enzyme [Penicillium chermesinum]